jgi:hypothetical protein
MTRMNKYPLKLIEWTDACNGNHDWFDPETMPTEVQLFLVQTIGFEVQRTDDAVVLAMSVSANGQLCDLFKIPRAIIVREQTFRSRLISSVLGKS